MTEKQRLRKKKLDEQRIWQQTNYAERILTDLESSGLDTERYSSPAEAIEVWLETSLPDIAEWWKLRKEFFEEEKKKVVDAALAKLTPTERSALGLK